MYYSSKEMDMPIDRLETYIKEKLPEFGFNVVSNFYLDEVIKKKLGKDIKGYRIIGACNPSFAYRAVESEPYAGLMLPCNIILREKNENVIEVAVVDPQRSMIGINNPELHLIAGQVRDKLKTFLESL